MLTKLTTYPNTCSPEDAEKTLIKNLLNYFPADVQVFGEYPRIITNILEKEGIKIKKEHGDAEILKNKTVYFVSFGCYMSLTESTKENSEKTAVNTVFGVKNPYLPSTDWGCQIDPKGLKYHYWNFMTDTKNLL